MPGTCGVNVTNLNLPSCLFVLEHQSFFILNFFSYWLYMQFCHMNCLKLLHFTTLIGIQAFKAHLIFFIQCFINQIRLKNLSTIGVNCVEYKL